MDQSRFTIWVDADACPKPVKEVVYKTSARLKLAVILVANNHMQIPVDPLIRFIKVADGANIADQYICDHVSPGDLVVTADIPLAALVVAEGATAINPRGETYTDENVQECLSMRDFMHGLRGEAGVVTGGPAAFGPKDKEHFANALNRFLAKAIKV